MYETLVLIDAHTEAPLSTALASVSAAVANSPQRPTVLQDGDSIRIEWAAFSLSIHRSELPHVLRESGELARRFAKGHARSVAIAQCNARFEIVGGDDFDLEYFTDYALVLEALEKIGTVYIFDQGVAEFTNL